MESSESKKFLKVSEVAQRYGLAIVTIYQKIQAGEFPAGVKIGRSHRWSIEELEKFERNLSTSSKGGMI